MRSRLVAVFAALAFYLIVGGDFIRDEGAPADDEPEKSTTGIGGTWSPPKQMDAHKPKVSTWGVYERPADISKAFGGGRQIGVGGYQPSEEEVRGRANTNLPRSSASLATLDHTPLGQTSNCGDSPHWLDSRRRAWRADRLLCEPDFESRQSSDKLAFLEFFLHEL